MSEPQAVPGFIDPDVDHLASGRPLHLRWRYVYVVFAGGMLGTLARWAVEIALPSRNGGLPWGTVIVNMVGSFVLGVLLSALVRAGVDEGWPRLARLHFGTGVVGAFTTYSALAGEVVGYLDTGRSGFGFGYLAASVLAGVLLAAVGSLIGGRTLPVRRTVQATTGSGAAS